MRVLVKTFWPAFCLIHPGLKLWKTFFSFGERNLRAQSKRRDSTNDGPSTWRFLLVARQAATLGLWRTIPRVGELPFLKGFSFWTDQSERVYFLLAPRPKSRRHHINKGWAWFEANGRSMSTSIDSSWMSKSRKWLLDGGSWSSK